MTVTIKFNVASAGALGFSPAWAGNESSSSLLWLFGLPNWVIWLGIVTMTTLIFAGAFEVFRSCILPFTPTGKLMRRYKIWVTPDFKQLKCRVWHFALAGSLAGAVLALTLADDWQDRVVKGQNALPVSAGIPPSDEESNPNREIEDD